MITNLIMKQSYKEKQKRKIMNFKTEKQRLKLLSNEELEFNYIELKTKCEYKSMLFIFFVILILIEILMSVWTKFFNFIQNVFIYTSPKPIDNIEVFKLSLIISIVMCIFNFIEIIFFMICLNYDINKMKKQLMLIEMVFNNKY